MSPSKQLAISRTLSFDIDYSTKAAAIIAQRRKGKTYTGSVIAEEMVKISVPFVVLDPTGAWWGLRASADGKRAGLPVVVLGGEHGDLPLDRTMGRAVADLVVDVPGFYVLDLSLFESGEAERQFATAFAERLYRRKGQPGMNFVLHVFVDEADRFAPQRPGDGDRRMLGAFETLVRRGGIRGIGVTMITQRAAVLNKNVLEQIDILIVLRTVGPNDRKAIDMYVVAYGDEELRAKMMGSVASLKLGQAWVFEPGGDPGLFELLQIRQRHTFNSSATPKAGENRIEPQRMAAVDLDAVKNVLSEAIAKITADDAGEQLKLAQREIRELHAEIARLRTAQSAAPPAEPQIVEHVPESVRKLTHETASLLVGNRSYGEVTIEMIADMQRRTEAVGVLLDRVVADIAEHDWRADTRPKPKPPTPVDAAAAADSLADRPRNAPRDVARATAPVAPNKGVTEAQQKILDTLGWLESVDVERPQREHVALFAGVSFQSSSYGKNLGALRSAQLIDYPSPGTIVLTDAGRTWTRAVDLPHTNEALHDALRSRLSPACWAILQLLIRVYPQAVQRDVLAGHIHVSPSSSSYGKNLGLLRSLGFIDYPEPGYITATPLLFVVK